MRKLLSDLLLHSVGVFIGLLIFFFSASEVTAQVVINEIMYDPSKSSTDTNGEWIELVNLGNSDIDLNGWKVNDNNSSHTISTSSIIAANGGLLVLCRNGDSNSNGGVSCGYVYSSLQLANTSDEVVIKDASDFEHDKVSYNNSSFPYQEGSSIELTSLLLDNSIGGNWHNSTSTFGLGDKGTPGLTNSSPPTPSPTPTATPTLAPTPTPTQNSPTPTIAPTKSPTPFPSKSPLPTGISVGGSSPTPLTEVLGIQSLSEETSSPVPTDGEKKKKFPFVSVLLIALGFVFIGFAGFSFYKNLKKQESFLEENSENSSDT